MRERVGYVKYNIAKNSPNQKMASLAAKETPMLLRCGNQG
jgi:hypothetical protein